MLESVKINELTESELRAIVAYMATPAEIRINALCRLANMRLLGLIGLGG